MQNWDISFEKLDSINELKTYGLTLTKLLALLGIGWSLFQFYTSGFGLLSALPQRSVTLVFTLVLVFALYPIAKKGRMASMGNTIDIILILLSLVVCAYTFLDYKNIAIRGGMPTTPDIILGWIAVGLIMEATRRTVG